MTANAVLTFPPQAAGSARLVGGFRRKRTPMPLDTKLRVIGWHADGKSIDYNSRQLGEIQDTSVLYNIIKQKDTLLARAAGGPAGSWVTSRTTDYTEVDRMPLEWFVSMRARGRKRVTLSLSIIRQKALHISEYLGVGDWAASNGFIQNWAPGHGLISVSLHETVVSAKVAEATARME